MSAEELGEAASSIIRSLVGSTDYPQVIADDEINLCVFANELAIVVAPIRGENRSKNPGRHPLRLGVGCVRV